MLKLEPYLKKCVIVNVWNIHHNIASCAGIRNPAFNPHGPRTCAGMFAIGLLDRQFAPRGVFQGHVHHRRLARRARGGACGTLLIGQQRTVARSAPDSIARKLGVQTSRHGSLLRAAEALPSKASHPASYPRCTTRSSAAA